METGQISTHAPQLVQAQSDSSLMTPPTIGPALLLSRLLLSFELQLAQHGTLEG